VITLLPLYDTDLIPALIIGNYEDDIGSSTAGPWRDISRLKTHPVKQYDKYQHNGRK